MYFEISGISLQAGFMEISTGGGGGGDGKFTKGQMAVPFIFLFLFLCCNLHLLRRIHFNLIYMWFMSHYNRP